MEPARLKRVRVRASPNPQAPTHGAETFVRVGASPIQITMERPIRDLSGLGRPLTQPRNPTLNRVEKFCPGSSVPYIPTSS